MQHATLLTFLEQLYNATRESEVELVRRVEDIQLRFSRFTSGIWFTEITPQVQGKELYDLWMREMGTSRLYEEVKAEINLAHEVLRNFEASRLSKEAGHVGAQTYKLTELATILLPVALVAGIFGMNLATVPDTFLIYRCWCSISNRPLCDFLFQTAFFAIVCAVAMWGVQRCMKRSGS